MRGCMHGARGTSRECGIEKNFILRFRAYSFAELQVVILNFMQRLGFIKTFCRVFYKLFSMHENRSLEFFELLTGI